MQNYQKLYKETFKKYDDLLNELSEINVKIDYSDRMKREYMLKYDAELKENAKLKEEIKNLEAEKTKAYKKVNEYKDYMNNYKIMLERSNSVVINQSYALYKLSVI